MYAYILFLYLSVGREVYWCYRGKPQWVPVNCEAPVSCRAVGGGLNRCRCSNGVEFDCPEA